MTNGFKPEDCRFHGRHRNRLLIVEECADCGHRSRRWRTSGCALWVVPMALCANALLLAVLVFG